MARTEVDNKPIYTNLVKGYSKHKTKDGYSIDSAFFKRYYSSLDAEIYFGNEFVEEVVAIDWQINQGQIPLFGYNSYVYDEIALGARLIQGNFVINFTSPNYLFKLLETAKQDSITDMGQYKITKTREEANIEERINTGTSGIAMPDRAPIWPQTFDIDVIFGEKTSIGTPVHVVLEGVLIKGCSMSLNTSGSPVGEVYSFIAKDLKTVE